MIIIRGEAETFSAFCFENNLSELRKYIRKPSMKLQQVYKRISEEDGFIPESLNINTGISLSQIYGEGPAPNNFSIHLCRQFKHLKFEGFTFAVSLRDSCCILKNAKICILKNILLNNGIISLILQEFKSKGTVP